ncbi:conserved hypothetical protein [Deferribacter desulfuricans SSM1]|uniref:AAA+ ATPase domain-containing protein n=1 Tax=Deferribacter desulfuricans (strain DSM 14783 / JCM 11476 / NBRC 101012 / SSM1) TaxID=639282 RepID=D3PDP4_DEFDS|nr:AAA family ATPase [Deferribacter desulfuricans]BAI80717.1 conserved hypothetical protein [Deferribacter desulfuricans SSM1]
MSVYTEFFNFKEEPFKLTPDPDFFYCSTSHEEAIQLIEYSIKTRKGFMALIGEVGTGKTTLTRVLLNSLTDVETCLVLNPFLSPDEMLKYICSDFGIVVSNDLDKGKIYDELAKYFLKLYEEGKNALLIIDEAQNLPFETIELIRQLSNIEKEDAKLLQILFVGQPEFLELLNKYELRQVRQRISVIIQLKTLTEEDVENYINYRIQKASKYNKTIFTKEAIKAVYKYTKGNPRDINKLCEYALIAAFNDESKKIEKKHIEKAILEINPILVSSEITPATTRKNSLIKKVIILFILIVITGLLIYYFSFLIKCPVKKVSNIENKTYSNINLNQQPAKTVTIQKEKVKKEIISENNTIKTKTIQPVSQDNISSKKLIKEEKNRTKSKCIKFLVNQKVRINPDLNSKYLTIIKKNKVLKIEKVVNDWAMINIDNKIGWVLLYDKYNNVINCED